MDSRPPTWRAKMSRVQGQRPIFPRLSRWTEPCYEVPHMRLAVATITFFGLWGLTSDVSAQTKAYDNTKVNIKVNDEEPYAAPAWVYINKADCEANVEIEFKLANLKSTPFLDIWRGTTDC